MLSLQHQYVASGLPQQRRSHRPRGARANDGDVNVFVLFDCLRGGVHYRL